MIKFNKSFNMMENEGDIIGMILGIWEVNDFLVFMGVIFSFILWVIGLSMVLGKKLSSFVLVIYIMI